MELEAAVDPAGADVCRVARGVVVTRGAARAVLDELDELDGAAAVLGRTMLIAGVGRTTGGGAGSAVTGAGGTGSCAACASVVVVACSTAVRVAGATLLGDGGSLATCCER